MQANFYDFDKSKDNDTAPESINQPSTYDAVMSDDSAKSDASKTDSNKNVTSSDVSSSTDQKTKNVIEDLELKGDKKSKRRGVWKRVRVRPVDSFEAAESQNIGKHLFNSLGENAKDYGNKMDKSDSEYPKGPADTYNLLDEFQFDDDAEVQTVLPIETTTKPEEYATTIDMDLNEQVNVTTEPTDTKDERESEATSTINYNSNDDEPTTVIPPFESVRNEVKLRSDKSTAILTNTSYASDDSGDDQEERMENEASGDEAQPSGSIMDEVKQKLTELFSFDDDDVVVTTTERIFKFNRNFKRPKSTLPLYTAIDRTPLVNDISTNIKDTEKTQIKIKTSPASMKLEPVPVLKTILRPIPEEQQAPSNFHKDLMDSVIYATSTSTEISHETEICYRGRCVKTQKKP